MEKIAIIEAVKKFGLIIPFKLARTAPSIVPSVIPKYWEDVFSPIACPLLLSGEFSDKNTGVTTKNIEYRGMLYNNKIETVLMGSIVLLSRYVQNGRRK